MSVSLVVAMSADRVIGRDGGLPWHLPRDLRRFKRLTLGHTLVVGRRTHESIGRPLPGRQTIVVSRTLAAPPAGTRLARSLEAALAMAGEGEVFVGGGGEVYAQALPLADRVYLTLVEAEVEGDAFFPELDGSWRLTWERAFGATEKNPHACRFRVYEKQATGVAGP